MFRLVSVAILGCVLTGSISAQQLTNPKHVDSTDRFHSIEHWLPTPGVYRTASGAPGPLYWQQRADYDIDVTLDAAKRRISGSCRITYYNRSPHPLSYVWLQLDQNRFRNDSAAIMSRPAPSLAGRSAFSSIQTLLTEQTFDGGYNIESVTQGKPDDHADADQQQPSPLSHLIVDTMMRVDLAQPLAPDESTEIEITYHYNIVDATVIRARSGFEHFEEDDNSIFEIAQWHPRMTAYTDYTGWQHNQFLGAGEFTLELGDFHVEITTPADMVVAATGTLANPEEVLKDEWIERLSSIANKQKPTFIITPQEAKANESAEPKDSADRTKTWKFNAENVRDFAWAASRKFIWDAMPVKVGDRTVTAMSYYPNEAEPLWSQYSTEAIAHTLEVYGRYTFDFPYEVAISVNGPVYGMEYPMLSFNGRRPVKDAKTGEMTYSKAAKYGLISVIIHEVGHNFFPMIVNSDERQWTWMDEGLNTFLQYLAEQEWEEDYPSTRGPAEKIVPYMRGGNQRPVMTGSDEILQFGNNAYGKPATALNILRETVLGRERFDFAFREYARRWKFKRPTPADFFRTMGDAAGTNLDWFWRGWFYSTDHVDIAIDSVELYEIDSGDPDDRFERKRRRKETEEKYLSDERNSELRRRIDWQPGLKDFYNAPDYDDDKVEESDRKAYQKHLESLDEEQRALLRRTTKFYVVKFVNKGGLVMPIPLRIHYADNTHESVQLPPEIWRYNSNEVKKLFLSEKEILRFEIDPKREIADTDKSNNHWPPKIEPTRFELFESKDDGANPMRKAADAAKKGDEASKKSDSDQKSDDVDKNADKPSNEAEAKEVMPDQDGNAETKPAETADEAAADAESAPPKKKRKEGKTRKNKSIKIKPDAEKTIASPSDGDDKQ